MNLSTGNQKVSRLKKKEKPKDFKKTFKRIFMYFKKDKKITRFIFLYKKKSKNRIIRINTGILSNMKQKIKEFYH